MDSRLYKYWTTQKLDDLLIEDLQKSLLAIQDDLFVSALCADRLVDNVNVQRMLLSLGVQRTQSAVDRSRAASCCAKETAAGEPIASSKPDEIIGFNANALQTYFRAVPQDAQLCFLRILLLQRLDRLNSFVEICDASDEDLVDDISGEQEEWEDPWMEVGPGGSNSAIDMNSKKTLPFTLSTFLSDDLFRLLHGLVESQWFTAITLLLLRHGSSLWPHRITMLESIPEHVKPSKYRNLLPSFDASVNRESSPNFNSWRSEMDWTETVDVQTILSELKIFEDQYCSSAHEKCCTHFLTGDELSAWYERRAKFILDCTGFVDNALEIVQLGAAHGVVGLEEFGEDLTLFSRLVYGTRQKFNSDLTHDWTLSEWHSLDALAVVRAYLGYSTPSTLPDDISRLVMPYLFVLESRTELIGKQDSTRILYDYILSCPLDMLTSIFENSNPIYLTSQRTIRDDEDMVRLALACLYGNGSLDQWSTMSHVFKYLPTWDFATDEGKGNAAIDSILAYLGDFMRPSTQFPRRNPPDLFNIYSSLSKNSLSILLDLLETHLESGKYLARWGVPVPLSWLLRSNRDVSEQRAWAHRMSRRIGTTGSQLDTLEDWEWLLEDMLKLARKRGTTPLGAFGLLTEADIMEIFITGVLSTGKFAIARRFLNDRNTKLTLDEERMENICLACSREFYDNAHAGNYKFGDMKLAYDCLDLLPSTGRIIKEKHFIEATSLILSFNVTSQPGVLLSPLEVRLTKDRLTLISRVLASNTDSYKHSEVILDLLYKLGYRGVVSAEAKVLAMLSDAAFQAEDFECSYNMCKKLIEIIFQILPSPIPLELDVELAEVRNVCWITCFQLGRHPSLLNAKKRLALLGYALQLCSPDRLHEVLTAWKHEDKEDIAAREKMLSGDKCDLTTSSNVAPVNIASSLRTRLMEFHMPSHLSLNTPDSSMLAIRTFKNVTSSFPFSPHSADDVSVHASRALSKGIGWLIGSDGNF